MKDWRNLLERAFPLELTQPRRPMKQGKTTEELASEDLANKEFICEDLTSEDLASKDLICEDLASDDLASK